MATTPESKVKKTVTKYLKELGVYYFYPATLQQKNLEDIKSAGGFDWVVNEENMHDTKELLDAWVTTHNQT